MPSCTTYTLACRSQYAWCRFCTLESFRFLFFKRCLIAQNKKATSSVFVRVIDPRRFCVSSHLSYFLACLLPVSHHSFDRKSNSFWVFRAFEDLVSSTMTVVLLTSIAVIPRTVDCFIISAAIPCFPTSVNNFFILCSFRIVILHRMGLYAYIYAIFAMVRSTLCVEQKLQ